MTEPSTPYPAYVSGIDLVVVGASAGGVGTLEAILTSLNSAVVVVDRDVRIQLWNRHARELWGLRADEVEGEHLLNLDIGLSIERLHQPIRACLGGEPPDSLAMPAVNRRGRAVDCVVRATPLLAATPRSSE